MLRERAEDAERQAARATTGAGRHRGDAQGLRQLARVALGEVKAPAEVLPLPSLSLKEKIEARAANAATPEDAARLRRLAASIRPLPPTG